METLQIKTENALRAYDEGDAATKKLLGKIFGEDIFKRDITERVKTMDDVLRITGHTRESFNEWCEGLESDEVAYREAKLIALALNEGTEMNLADTDQLKYFPWFDVKPNSAKPAGFALSDGDYGLSHSTAHLGARLAFKSKELAIYAGKTFPEVYERLFA